MKIMAAVNMTENAESTFSEVTKNEKSGLTHHAKLSKAKQKSSIEKK